MKQGKASQLGMLYEYGHTKTTLLNRLGVALAAGGLWLVLAATSRAQAPAPTSSYTNTFDTSSSVASWLYWYGIYDPVGKTNYFNNTAMTWDSTMDAESNPSGGSLMVSIPFGLFGPSGDQAVWFGTFDNAYGYDNSITYDGSRFANITVKIHVQPGTAVDASGDFGSLLTGLVDHNWSHGGTFYGSGVTIPSAATNGWVTLTQAVDITDPLLSTPGSSGVDFKYTSYSGYPTNPITFWLDDLEVNLIPTNVIIPPPTLALPYKPVPGLNLFSSVANGGNNQRTSIGLTNSGVGNAWLGAAGPVTYSITITNFPNPAVANYGAYQAQIFLTSGKLPLPGYESAPDYNETNLVFLEIDETPTGTGYASFRYKINEPNSNANVYGTDNGTAGTLVTLNASAVLGTWSLTFNNNTSVTLSGPGGASTNFVFTNAVAVTGGATNFADPLNIFFGGQANNTALIGQAVVLSGVSVTGNGNPVSDNFMTDTPPLNTNLWGIYASDPSTVQLLPADPGALWVKWTLPDSGFSLQTSSSLANPGSWMTLPPLGSAPLASISSSGFKSVYVPGADLTSTNQAYFQLIKRVATQLQVLLPGETNAPGTATGKIGTPDPQALGVPLDLTINACDATWHIASSADTVAITSSDPSAFLPPNATLVNGTVTISQNFFFGSSGTWTVTATDVTTNAVSAGTSTPITIP